MHIISSQLKSLGDLTLHPNASQSQILKRSPETWSQRAVANQSLGRRTAMISHLQHVDSKGDKNQALKSGILTRLHLWILSFSYRCPSFCVKKRGIWVSLFEVLLNLNSFFLFDKSLSWSNLAWRLIFEGKRKEKKETQEGKKGGEEGNRKGRRKGPERNKKEQKGTKREEKGKERTAKQSKRNKPAQY